MVPDAARQPLTKSVFTPEYAHFAARIVALRKDAGLTQAELAQRLGRPQSYVSKYERGERRLDVVEFLAVAHAMGANAAQLMAEMDLHKGKPASSAAAGRSGGQSGGSPRRRG